MPVSIEPADPPRMATARAPQSPAFGVPAVGPRRRRRNLDQLLISSDHFFVFVSVLTTFATELSEFYGQNG